MFLDPPYTAPTGKRAGSRLYAHADVDHAALFAMLAERDSNFLMTYDAAPEIVDLVRQHDFHAVGVFDEEHPSQPDDRTGHHVRAVVRMTGHGIAEWFGEPKYGAVSDVRLRRHQAEYGSMSLNEPRSRPA